MRWGPTEHLLAAAVDALQAANWQRSGNKHAPRPKAVHRPGTVDPTRRKIGTASYTPADMRKILDNWGR